MNTSWSGNRVGFPPATRRLILQRDSVCRACRRRPSTVADHIVPKAEGGSDDVMNGQGLCDPCHAIKTRKEQQRGKQRRSARGRLTPEPHPGIQPGA